MSKKYNEEDIIVRAARKEDMSGVSKMLQELADFEEMPDGPKLSVKDLERDGFDCQPPSFLCKVAEVASDPEKPLVGYALYFPTYSTWEGKAMMLEDLYVSPSIRGQGVGERLFDAVAKVLTALFFFASGSYQRPVGVARNVSQKMCSVYIEEVTEALTHKNMLNKYIRFPDSPAARQTISHRFYTKYRIPGVIGCIDGTHIKIFRPPKEEEHWYYCRKHYHSLNVQMEAVASGCSRLDFHVLEWNRARAFYERKGAQNLTQKEKWCYYRLSGDALTRLLSK